jgi:hypothetical protein
MCPPGLLALALFGLPGRAAPCSCIPAPPLNTRAAVARLTPPFDVILEGRVVRVTEALDTLATSGSARPFALPSREATVRVRRQWRGSRRDSIVVRSSRDGTACGFPLEEGAHVLIFASGDASDTVTTTSCSPSRAWDNEAARLARLLGPPQSSR